MVKRWRKAKSQNKAAEKQRSKRPSATIALVAVLAVVSISVGLYFIRKVAKAETTPPHHYSVHILAGQSNMVGAGSNPDTGFQASPDDQKIKFYHAGQSSSFGNFVPLQPQNVLSSTPKSVFGPEVAVGRQLVRSGVKDVVVIKVAVGSTSLEKDWKVDSGPLYDLLKTKVNEALGKLSTDGSTYSLDGFYWMQGESDAVLGYSSTYEANLRDFITRIRQDLSANDMPFILGQINAPKMPADHRAKVRAAQADVADSTFRARWVGTDDLPLTDGLHYNNDGLTSLGDRFFAEVWPMMQARYSYLIPSANYRDVPAKAGYKVAADWAKQKSIITGYKNGTFRPKDNVDRKDTVQILWRMMGSPTGYRSTNFKDVPAKAGYKRALDWAVATGVIAGYKDNTFRPTNKINRAQLVQYLWTIAGKKPASQPSGFGDVPSNAWYKNGVDWAKQYNVVAGYKNSTFRANNRVSRSQLVALLFELAKNESAWNNRNQVPASVLF